jgi:DNA polymerase
VFGEGPQNAKLVLVGEQPGDEEDRCGRPFVGPAGCLLDDAMRQVGIERSEVYMTNSVKHFKYEERGKRRLHRKPNRTEVVSCRAWLERELQSIGPQVVVCLGATAAESVISFSWRVSRERGRIVPTTWCAQTIATYHPSAILRSRLQGQADAKRQALIDDLQLAKSLLSTADVR